MTRKNLWVKRRWKERKTVLRMRRVAEIIEDGEFKKKCENVITQ